MPPELDYETAWWWYLHVVQGHTFERIATDHYYASSATVYNRFKRHGLKGGRPRGGKPKLPPRAKPGARYLDPQATMGHRISGRLRP